MVRRLSFLLLLLLLCAQTPVPPMVKLIWDTGGSAEPVDHYRIWRRDVPCAPPSTRALASPVSWIPQRELTVASVSHEETAKPGWRAVRAIDGLATTMWHTDWSGSVLPPHPHTIVLDAGEPLQVTAIRYLPRQDGDKYGVITKYQLSVSLDNQTWGQPVSQGTLAGDNTAKTIAFAPVQARYVRLVALADASGYAYTSAAEIQVGTMRTTQDGYQLVGTVPGSQTTYTEPELPGLQCWRVTAVSATGEESPPSNIAQTPPDRIEVQAPVDFRREGGE